MLLVNPKPNVLPALLENINLIANTKQTFWMGYPALYQSILLYFILNIATVAN